MPKILIGIVIMLLAFWYSSLAH